MTQSIEQDEPASEGKERLVLWYRATPVLASEAEAMALRKRVGTRLEVAGGEIIARVGSSAAASFDPLELDDVIELALGLLGDARAEATPAEVACALAVGELTQSDDGGAPAGSAIDRAQLLAACADPLELALDEPAHARAQDTYLFTRSFVAGPITGHALDPDYAKKRECRRALGALRPAPLPDGARPLFERLSELALRAGLRRISLSAPQQHAALDLIERLRAALRPALVLHLGRHAAGLQPLGGLQLALRRAQDQLRSTLDLTLGNAVARFADGAPLSREEGVVALRELLRQASSSGRRVWIVLDRPREIDRASLTVVTEAVAEQAGDHLLWLLVDDYGTPGGLLLGADEHEAVAMEPLSERDRAQVAETVLGLETGSELGMRVARLGGDTALGILEAARTLVGSGDLVIDAGVFRWRTQPRGSSLPIPVDALLTERAAGLEPAAHRTLEALCVAPPAASSELIARVMALDGLSPDAAAGGLAQLRLEGWLDEHGGLGPLEHAVRSAVRNGMPPARAAELHRFVADVLGTEATLARGASYGHALLAHHLAEGGRELEAADALLNAAQAATDAGFARMAVRLAALALKLDGSAETRQRARRVAGTIDSLPPPPNALPTGVSSSPPGAPDRASSGPASDPKAMAGMAIQSAISAIIRGELDAAEGLIDTAIAAGFGRAGAQRLWSVAQLKRGNVPEAVRSLKHAHVPAGSPGTRSREAIAAALILLQSGESLEAVRAALEALAGARRAHDARGERVALYVLSGCYQALGREADADKIANAAAAARP